MSHTESSRRARSAVIAVLVVVSAAFFGYQSLTASSSSATAPITVTPLANHPPGSPHSDRQAALGAADGVVPDGTTVFNDVPAVANLDAKLLRALRQAATEAAGGGVTFEVNSGWRSPAYQEHLLDQAVSQYGSKEEAARWVATPTTSPHVSGNAVDIGPSAAAAWLSRHGAAYGLCQIYRNEPWHYELRPAAIGRGCSPMYADPTHDPRMQK